MVQQAVVVKSSENHADTELTESSKCVFCVNANNFDNIHSVSHTLTILWRPTIVWIWNMKKYFRLSNAYRRFSQSLLFALLLMASALLIQGCISEKKIIIWSCFQTWSSALHALRGSSTHTHTHTHTHTRWQMVVLCATLKQPWISYKMTQLSPMPDCYGEVKDLVCYCIFTKNPISCKIAGINKSSVRENKYFTIVLQRSPWH